MFADVQSILFAAPWATLKLQCRFIIGNRSLTHAVGQRTERPLTKTRRNSGSQTLHSRRTKKQVSTQVVAPLSPLPLPRNSWFDTMLLCGYPSLVRILIWTFLVTICVGCTLTTKHSAPFLVVVNCLTGSRDSKRSLLMAFLSIPEHKILETCRSPSNLLRSALIPLLSLNFIQLLIVVTPTHFIELPVNGDLVLEQRRVVEGQTQHVRIDPYPP